MTAHASAGAALGLALVVMGGAAASDDIPRYDSEAACRKIAFSAEGYAACVRQEQSAYDLAKLVWPRLDGASRAACTVSLKNQPAPYRTLEACALARLRQLDLSGPASPPPRFRY